jgi:hypothetical protein
MLMHVKCRPRLVFIDFWDLLNDLFISDFNFIEQESIFLCIFRTSNGSKLFGTSFYQGKEGDVKKNQCEEP